MLLSQISVQTFYPIHPHLKSRHFHPHIRHAHKHDIEFTFKKVNLIWTEIGYY